MKNTTRLFFAVGFILVAAYEMTDAQQQPPTVEETIKIELKSVEVTLRESLDNLDRAGVLRTLRVINLIQSIDESSNLVQILRPLLSRETDSRTLACDALGLDDNPTLESIELLIERLEIDSNASVRSAAATSLARLAQRSRLEPLAIKSLIRAAESDTSVTTRCRAIAAVATAVPFTEGMIPIYRPWLCSKEPFVRVAALNAIGEMGTSGSWALTDVTHCLRDEHLEVQRAAIATIAKIHDGLTLPPPELLAGLSNEDSEISDLAETALRTYGSAAMSRLIERLTDDSPTQGKMAAVRLIGRLNREDRAVAALVPLMSQRDRAVKLEAAIALAGLGEIDDAILEVLVQALANELQLKAGREKNKGIVAEKKEFLADRLRSILRFPSTEITERLVEVARGSDSFRSQAAIQLLDNADCREVLPLMKELLVSREGGVIADVLNYCEQQGFSGTMTAMEGLYSASYETRRLTGYRLGESHNYRVALSPFCELLAIEKFGSTDTIRFNEDTRQRWSNPWIRPKSRLFSRIDESRLQTVSGGTLIESSVENWIGLLIDVLLQPEVDGYFSALGLAAIGEQSQREEAAIAMLRDLAKAKSIPARFGPLLLNLLDTKFRWDHDRKLHQAAIEALISLGPESFDRLLPLLASKIPLQRHAALAVVLKVAPDHPATCNAAESFLIEALDWPEPEQTTQSEEFEAYRDLITLLVDARSHEGMSDVVDEIAPHLAYTILRQENPTLECRTMISKCVKQGDVRMVLQALKLVGKLQIWDDEIKTAVNRHCSSPDERVRVLALETIATFEPTESAQLGLAHLQDESPTVRDAATVCIVAKPTYESIDSLCVMLRNARSKDLRVAAIRALGLLGQAVSTARDELLHCLEDKHPQIRKAAIRALRNIESPDIAVVQTFRDAARDLDSGVRCEALIGLSRFGNDFDCREILAGMTSINASERAWTAFAIGRLANLPDDAIVTALIRAQKDEHSSVRHNALWALRQVGEHSERVADCFDDRLDDENEMCVFQAVLGAGQMGALGRRSIERMIAVSSKHDNIYLAPAVLGSLGRLGRSIASFMPQISKAIAEDPYLFDDEISLYLRLFDVVSPTSESIPALTRVASEKGFAIAVKILGEIGVPAFDALQKLTRSSASPVKDAAMRVLSAQQFSSKEVRPE